MTNHNFIDQIPSDTPILIAGQTASGRSQLALQIAEKRDSVIINADAIQVFENWRILTARPSTAEESKVKHELYGCLLYTSPSPRDKRQSRMPSSA